MARGRWACSFLFSPCFTPCPNASEGKPCTSTMSCLRYTWHGYAWRPSARRVLFPPSVLWSWLCHLPCLTRLMLDAHGNNPHLGANHRFPLYDLPVHVFGADRTLIFIIQLMLPGGRELYNLQYLPHVSRVGICILRRSCTTSHSDKRGTR